MEISSRATDGEVRNAHGGGSSNHLSHETSPYLRQHASNPVDWYPWCDEALERAKQDNRPIFLSVGYSACHWCHVMERESFTDPTTAGLLNEHFISIKVDREERPDVDEIYMTAVQLLTGSGGWPLNVFLTPNLEPFFGGTYFPPADGYGRPGFRGLLEFLKEAWQTSPEQVIASAASLTEAIRRTVDKTEVKKAPVDEVVIHNAVSALKTSFDTRWGGFGVAPKFPPSSSIALLLRQYQQTKSQDQLQMATVTLDRMAQGGIHDHVGGGFHRYSVDERWLVPHFEKMLYDNALLASAYLEAAAITGNETYKRVAQNTLDFVLRDMTDSAGGFHCAFDADSEGEEGRFYVWKADEIQSVLGDREAALFSEYFGVNEAGNFEGSNVLHYSEASADSVRRQLGSDEALVERLGEWCEQLRRVRAEREWPGKDEKILASWNGLMISALALGYRVLGDERYLRAAVRTANFVLKQMCHEGGLQHMHSSNQDDDVFGTRSVAGFLDDYAVMANALTDLYETTSQGRWLEAAAELTGRMIVEFYDDEGGGFFFTSKSHEHLLVRTKPYHDGAVPSGNSAAALVLLRLANLLKQSDLRIKAEEVFGNTYDLMSTRPEGFTQMLCAVALHLRLPAKDVVS